MCQSLNQRAVNINKQTAGMLQKLTFVVSFLKIETFMARIMEDNRRKSTSVRQLEQLITFMEAHSNFAIGQLRSREGRALATRLWEQCADILNSEGVARAPKDWSRFWNDYKCRVRAKLAEINRAHRATGGGPSTAPQLSPLEERVAALLGRDAGPLSGVRQDPDVQIIEMINTELDGTQVAQPEDNSPVLDLSIIQECTGAPVNSPPATPDFSRTVTLETPPIPTERHNQPAGQGNTPRTGRRRDRLQRRSRTRPRFVHQSNTAALEEARAVIARIEEMRTRTEEVVAETHRNVSQAALNICDAMTSIAGSLHIYVSGLHRPN